MSDSQRKSENLRKLKDRASRLHAEGKFKDALKLYEQVVAEDAGEIQCRLKIGDLYKRLGQREAAVKSYEPVARHYAEDGLFLKAVAVCKMVMAVDPNHAGTRALMQELHSKRRVPATAPGGMPLKPPPPRAPVSQVDMLERSFGLANEPASSAVGDDDEEEMVIERSAERVRPSAKAKAPAPEAGPLPAPAWPPRPGAGGTPMPTPPSGPLPTPAWPPTPGVAATGAPAPAAAAAWPPIVAGKPTTSPPVVAGVPASPPAAAWPPAPPRPVAPPTDTPDEALDITVSSIESEDAIHEDVDLDEDSDTEDELKSLLGKLANDEPPSAKPPPPPPPSLPPGAKVVEETWDGVIKVEDVDGPPPDDAGGEVAPIVLTDIVSTAEIPIAPELVAELTAAEKEAPIELTRQTLAGARPVGRAPIDAPPAPSVVDDNDSSRFEASNLDELSQPQIPLFSELPKNAFVELLVQMDMKELTPGEFVIREGEIGDSFFVLATGKVRVSRRGDAGSEVVLAYLTDGAFFGEMALLQGGPRTASVIVEEDAQIFEIKKELLDQVVEKYPSVAQVLKNFYKQRLLSTAMATHPLFRPFSQAERRQLMEMFKSRGFPSGEALLEEGKKGSGLFLTLYGRLEVSKMKDGQRVVLAELGTGDMFGEMSLLTGKPTIATVRALTEVFVLRLSKRKFDEVIMTHPQVLELISVISDERHAINESLLKGQDQSFGSGTILV